MKVFSSIAIAGCLAAAVALSGCTAGHDSTSLAGSSSGASTASSARGDASSSAPAKGSSGSSSKSSQDAPLGSVSLPAASSIKNVDKERKSVVMDQCAAQGSGWMAGGTVANPGTAPAKYTITVFFTNEH